LKAYLQKRGADYTHHLIKNKVMRKRWSISQPTV
jgi:hypothetical protein